MLYRFPEEQPLTSIYEGKMLRPAAAPGLVAPYKIDFLGPAVLEEERQTFHRMTKLRPLRPSHSKGMDRDWPS